LNALKARFSGVFDQLVVLAIIGVVWQLAYLAAGDIALASPLTTLNHIAGMIGSAAFWPNVWATMQPFAIALAAEIAVGVVIGAALGVNRLANEVFEPLLVGFYALPKVLFYPVIVLSIGIGQMSEVVFAFLGGVFPVALFTMAAVRTLKPIYMRTARSLRLSLWQRIWSVAIPAVLPEIFSGIRIAYGATLLGVLLYEMFGSKSGLGNLLMSAIAVNRVAETLSIAVLLAIFAGATNWVLLVVDRRLHARR